MGQDAIWLHDRRGDRSLSSKGTVINRMGQPRSRRSRPTADTCTICVSRLDLYGSCGAPTSNRAGMDRCYQASRLCPMCPLCLINVVNQASRWRGTSS